MVPAGRKWLGSQPNSRASRPLNPEPRRWAKHRPHLAPKRRDERGILANLLSICGARLFGREHGRVGQKNNLFGRDLQVPKGNPTWVVSKPSKPKLSCQCSRSQSHAAA